MFASCRQRREEKKWEAAFKLLYLLDKIRHYTNGRALVDLIGSAHLQGSCGSDWQWRGWFEAYLFMVRDNGWDHERVVALMFRYVKKIGPKDEVEEAL